MWKIILSLVLSYQRRQPRERFSSIRLFVSNHLYRLMYALSFDMGVTDLKEYYGEIYNNAYYEIRKILIKDGFEWIQGSTYLTRSDNLINLTRAIIDLKDIEWFRKSVRDIRGYRVEEWSDFTDLVRG